jgi:hypothetical protein
MTKISNQYSLTNVITADVVNGRVGIGTESTGFNAAGLPLVVGSGSGNTGLTIFSGSTSSGSIHFADAETTGSASFSGFINYDHTGNSMQFGTTNTERMRITSGGNVGIGTTTANSRLTVFGNIEIIPPTTSNAKIRLVTCHGDGGLNQVQVYWNIAFGAKAAGGCLGAYDTGGNYAAPSANIAGSSLWTIYGFIGV